MMFKSKPEAYLYSIYILNNILKNSRPQDPYILNAIHDIQILIENHEQNPATVANRLLECARQLKVPVEPVVVNTIKRLAKDIHQFTSPPQGYERVKNHLGRRFESQIQIEILENPSDNMMAAVKLMSDRIIGILDSKQESQKVFCRNLSRFHDDTIAFGSLDIISSYARIKQVLQKNDKQYLARIMHIHFSFARGMARKLDGVESLAARNMTQITEDQMSDSAYYKDRGRKGKLRQKYTQRMGIMSSHNRLYNTTLPRHWSEWIADAKSQRVDYTSNYVKRLIDNDVPYVAGPSGMTALYIGQFLAYMPDASADDKKRYLLAVAAYLVSGGFHSLHEVLGPIAFCLPEHDLIPGYVVTAPDLSQKNPPPNYHVFYSHLTEIDNELSSIRASAWNKLNMFFEQEYLPSQHSLPSYFEYSGDGLACRVLDGLHAYAKRPKRFFSYTLRPDSSRGDVRAQTYINLLRSSKSQFNSLVISYAAIASIDGIQLKEFVAKSLGCKNPQQAIVLIKNLLTVEMTRLRGTELDHHSEDIKHLKTCIKTIVELADNNYLYTQHSQGKFDSALEWINAFESDTDEDRIPSDFVL